MMKIFLFLVTMVTVALGSTFDAVMTIVDLDRASLKTASKNAIVATASQLMGSDVSVAFKSSQIGQVNKNGVKGSSFTGVMTLSVTADLADFPQYSGDCALTAALSAQLQNLVEVNAVYQAKAWQFKASELTGGNVVSFVGVYDKSACQVSTDSPTLAPTNAPTLFSSSGSGIFNDPSGGLDRRLTDSATNTQLRH